MSSSASAGNIPGRITAKAISINIDNACNAFLHDCFRQFGIHVVSLPGDPVNLFSRRKFEACVLRLYDPDAEKILQAARNSNSNRRIVIYGIARSTQEALRFSKYGVNAVFDEPLDRQSVLKVVRSTHLLVIHELRRYVRIPVVTDVKLDIGSGSTNVVSVEVSSGGMSVRSSTPIASQEPVQLTTTLPGLPKLTLRAYICWAKPAEKLYGLRYDPGDERRLRVRGWIDQYLEIV